jgi:hypothetical protein
MKKTYHGSCHCGAVRFEADVDLMAGSRRCNCTYCAKTRYWKAFVGVDDIRLLAGEDNLADYRAPDSLWPPDHIHHYFCTTCGVQVYSKGYLDQMGGWFYALNLAALDDASDVELAMTPIEYENGIEDKQMEPPAVTAYL